MGKDLVTTRPSKELKTEKNIHSFIVCIDEEGEFTSLNDLSEALYSTKVNEIIANSAVEVIALAKLPYYTPSLAIASADDAKTDAQLQLINFNFDQSQEINLSDQFKQNLNTFIQDQIKTIYYRAIVKSEVELKAKIDELVNESNLTLQQKEILMQMPYSDLDDRSFKSEKLLNKKAGFEGIAFKYGITDYLVNVHNLQEIQFISAGEQADYNAVSNHNVNDIVVTIDSGSAEIAGGASEVYTNFNS